MNTRKDVTKIVPSGVGQMADQPHGVCPLLYPHPPTHTSPPLPILLPRVLGAGGGGGPGCYAGSLDIAPTRDIKNKSLWMKLSSLLSPKSN